jgi:hypothetical protein
LEKVIDPWNLLKYIKAAKKLRLNRVHQPFWRDWVMADPSEFLTPEVLHHWHKMLSDHDKKWATLALGTSEIDFRYSILHPHTGM